MKFEIFAAGVICLGLSACASPNEGNPNGAAYFGSPGSTYDMTANPPRANGAATYDPSAPLPADNMANGSAMAPPPGIPQNTR